MPSRPRTRLTAAVLPLSALLAPVLLVTARPAAAAPLPAPSPVTAEAERLPASGRSSVAADATASGRSARVLARGASVRARLTAPTTGSRLVVRLRSTSHTAAARTTPTPARAASARSTTALDDAYESRIVQLVNVHRTAAGLGRLTVSACADRFAEQWSATMASTGVFAHRSSLSPLLSTCAATAVGENIAYGSVSPDQLMSLWMHSPGHRANILDPRFTVIGVGAVRTASGRVYGTQNFLRR